MLSASDPAVLAIQILILLFSVIVHEVMHGWVALKFGDRTAENAGRLTLNPIPHIDIFGTIILPALLILSGSRFLFAWAKPVPVNPLNFTNIRKGELWVSAAGVISNFGLAIVAAILFHLLGIFSTPLIILYSLVYAVKINLMLGVFNLIPIPPLDGSKILFSQVMPTKLAQKFGYGFLGLGGNAGVLLLFLLLYTGFIGKILQILVTPLYALLGIPL